MIPIGVMIMRHFKSPVILKFVTPIVMIYHHIFSVAVRGKNFL